MVVPRSVEEHLGALARGLHLHYGASAKVFLQFRRRFWEADDEILGDAAP